ncbi:MAG: DsbA family protein [Rhodospirillaceae bacterium]|nr:DsbA family protein [Rhodospirillaceae bacterium]
MTIFANFSTNLPMAFAPIRALVNRLFLLIFVLMLAVPEQSDAGIADLSEAISEKVLGNADAKVEIHEYASLSCSHCADFHVNVLPDIKKNYIDTGKVRLIYHDFPLGDLALAASMLSRCAGNDRFFPMIGTLFKSQEQWAHSKNPLASLTGISRMIGGMDENDVSACLDSNDLYLDISGKLTKYSENLGINSTPTFFINGKKIEGVLSYEDFSDILDKAIKANNK